MIRLILLAIFSLFSICSASAEEEKTPKQKVVIVVGTHHYSPQKSMPLFAEELNRLGLESSVIYPGYDPEKGTKGIPGLEALAEADLAMFFTRFLKLPDDQLKHITDYLEAGKPVYGLRTSNHGFKYAEGHANQKWNDGFGRDALGSRYLIHLAGSTQISPIEGVKHPILTGVDVEEWTSLGTLYLTDLQEGAKPLLHGTGKSKRTGKVKNGFGTHELAKEMTDVVAWTWTNKWGGRTFNTSLGHTGDFAVEPSMRVMVNGVFWALGQDVPAADTKIETFVLSAKKKNKKK